MSDRACSAARTSFTLYKTSNSRCPSQEGETATDLPVALRDGVSFAVIAIEHAARALELGDGKFDPAEGGDDSAPRPSTGWSTP